MTTTTGIASLDLAGCPACGAPTEVIERFVLESTGEPIEHVKVHCARRHHFLMPTGALRPADVGGGPCGPPPMSECFVKLWTW